MTQFEIIKKTKIEFIIYGSIGLITSTLGLVLLSDTTENITLILPIGVLLFIAFKIIPNVSIKKHIKLGEINFENNKLTISNNNREKEYPIEKFEFINLKLVGWDGQNRFGNIQNLGRGNSGLYANTRPLNGLENRLIFRINNKEFKYEFYADSIEKYEKLKQLSQNWKKLNRNLELNILR
jgi:hypothetical protein